MQWPAAIKPTEIAARAWVLVGFLLPLNKSLAVIAMLLIGVFSWVGNDVKSNLKQLRTNYLLWLPALYFFWHLISMAWSDDLAYGWRDIQTKLSFLIVPLIIGSNLPGKRAQLNFFVALMVGVILNGLWSLYNAFQAFEIDGLTSHFFYIELSPMIHVAYLTMMVTLCMLFLIYDLFYSRKLDPQPWALSTALLMLAVFTILLDSRTALFTMMLVCSSYFLVTAFTENKLREYLPRLIGFVLIFFVSFYALSRIHNRMGELKSAVKNFNQVHAPEIEGAPTDYGNAGVRPVLWRNAWAVIQQHPIKGVGTGDIKDELQTQYKKTGFLTGVHYKLNPHNQYLHTAVSLGFIGLLLMLAMLLIPMWKALQTKNWFTLACLGVFVLNSLTESILEVQSGVLLFALVYCLVVPGVGEREEKSLIIT